MFIEWVDCNSCDLLRECVILFSYSGCRGPRWVFPILAFDFLDESRHVEGAIDRVVFCAEIALTGLIVGGGFSGTTGRFRLERPDSD